MYFLLSIEFLDDMTLPQISLVSGAPNIVCQGQIDPFVSNSFPSSVQKNRGYTLKTSRSRSRSRSRDRSRAYIETDGFNSEDDFDEEKIGELYHFKIKNVPINFQKATSVPFMDDIKRVPYTNNYSIKLDQTMANNIEIPANHQFRFPMKHAPPLPRGPVMIFIQNEKESNFSTQTWIKAENNYFSLDTTSSNEIYACYSVVSGEKTKEKIHHESREAKKQKLDENILYR